MGPECLKVSCCSLQMYKHRNECIALMKREVCAFIIGFYSCARQHDVVENCWENLGFLLVHLRLYCITTSKNLNLSIPQYPHLINSQGSGSMPLFLYLYLRQSAWRVSRLLKRCSNIFLKAFVSVADALAIGPYLVLEQCKGLGIFLKKYSSVSVQQKITPVVHF